MIRVSQSDLAGVPGDANDGVEVRTILDGKMLLDMVRLFPSKFI